MYQIVTQAALLAVGAFFAALILTRIMGRKMISQMTFFDFVIGITMGSATASIPRLQENTALSSLVALIVIASLALLIDFAHIKSFFIRKTIESEPVTVVKNGKIVDKNMKRIRLTLEELMMKLREKNVFNIGDVEFALMETDGKISVLPKSQKQPLTPSDLKIPTSYKGLTKDLVIDGNIMYENLQDVQLNKQWLLDQLKDHGVKDVKEVFYAGLDTSGNLYVSKKQKSSEKEGEYGIE